MSFLQKRQLHKINRKDLETKTISLRTCLIVYQSIKISLISRTYSPNKANAVKRMSRYISIGRPKGSITVETALVLPLFLFFLVNLISIIQIFHIYSSVEAALHQVGRKMAVYAYATEEALHSNGMEATPMSSVLLSATYVKESVIAYLGEDYLERSPIQGGSQGISFLQSDIMEEDDIIDLIAVYEVAPAFRIMGFDNLRVVNRCRVRAWTGYHNKRDGTETGSEDEIVYIAENGTVYHRDRNCTHLKLSIQAVAYNHIMQMRNDYGSRYELCELCSPATGGIVYITTQGNRYHTSAACSGLKRTVIAITLKEAGGKSPCLRCG